MDQAARRTDLMDVLDRVLDKGIVIDAGIRIAVAGIDLVMINAKVTVASIETYLQLAEEPRAYELGLIGGPPRRSTEEELGRLIQAKERAREEADREESAASPGAGVAPTEPRLPLAAYHDEELSANRPEEKDPGEEE